MIPHTPTNSLGFPDIPEDRIAQTPLAQRDQAKLLMLNRSDGALSHGVFGPNQFSVGGGRPCFKRRAGFASSAVRKKNDRRACGGSAVGPLHGSGLGTVDRLDHTPAPCRGRHPFPGRFARPREGPLCRWRMGIGIFRARGTRFGALGPNAPSPYIKRSPEGNAEDLAVYQTVYSTSQNVFPGETTPEKAVSHPSAQPIPQGAVAAPTAGLHFTPDLLEKMRKKGVRVHFVTLWVGWGTFRPIATDDIRAHRMLPEPYRVPQETADALRAVRREGKKCGRSAPPPCAPWNPPPNRTNGARRDRHRDPLYYARLFFPIGGPACHEFSYAGPHPAGSDSRLCRPRTAPPRLQRSHRQKLPILLLR